jgi:hypothetical protein
MIDDETTVSVTYRPRWVVAPVPVVLPDPPANTVAPVVSGTTAEGETLSVTDGTWTGGPSYTYQWKRDGASITSATNNTYLLDAADIGAMIKCTVTATNAGGSTGADSNEVGPITAPPFDPTSIAGLEMWLDADQLVLANDDPVATWTDESGNGTDATQATGGSQPLFKTAVQNSLPAVLFDGTDDWLRATVGADTSRTVFVVAKATAGTSGRTLWGYGGNARLRISSTGTWEWFRNEATTAVGLGGTATNTTIITLVVTDASTASGYLDDGTATAFDPDDSVTTLTTIDLGQNPNVNRFPGYVMEVLAYDSALSDTDRGNVRDYLNTKWSVY